MKERYINIAPDLYKQLDNKELIVLIALSFQNGEYNTFSVTVNGLANKTKLSPDTVEKALQSLERKYYWGTELLRRSGGGETILVYTFSELLLKTEGGHDDD